MLVIYLTITMKLLSVFTTVRKNGIAPRNYHYFLLAVITVQAGIFLEINNLLFIVLKVAMYGLI